MQTNAIRVFSGPLSEFRYKLQSNQLFFEMERMFTASVGHSASPPETVSWKASLPRLDNVLQLAGLPGDVHVALEERVPYFSERMDACLFGHTASGSPHMVIVELKGWGEATATDSGNVATFLGGTVRDKPHPSAQAAAYCGHLEDYRRAFQGSSKVGMASCAYCHNYPGIVPDEGLFHPQFDALRLESPTFGGHDAKVLAEYLDVRLQRGHGGAVIDAYDRAGIGPSKSLLTHAGEMIATQNVFRLLDDQLAAANEISKAVLRAAQQKRRQVILVRGGPGTGKSVVALNALGEVLRKDLTVYLVTGSSAFTSGMRRVLGKRLAGQVRFTDFFWDKPDSADVLIIDEAHRIRAKSVPKVAGYLRPTISQVEELIRAAKVTVFMVDENQMISPDEAGEPAAIRETAHRLGCEFREFDLAGQFRCAGSSAYLNWMDDMLALKDQPLALRLYTPLGFDFDVVDDPAELLAWVQAHNRLQPNSARVMAGWCWPWSDPLPNGLVNDIVIGEFSFPWESKHGKRPPPGIPAAKDWALDPAGVDQAGTVYSVQGFETRHAGVIFGPDLVVRDGRWVAFPRCNFSNGLRANPAEVALPYLKRIYRTLLSRPTESCRVYSTDAETRGFLRGRLVWG